MTWPAAVLALKATLSFPLLLPAHMPADLKHVRQYALVEEHRADYYSIDVAAVPGCNGAHVCSNAHVIGSKRPLHVGYTPSVCAAYCNDAVLTWKQDGAHYSITLKAGKLSDLKVMQQSMRRY